MRHFSQISSAFLLFMLLPGTCLAGGDLNWYSRLAALIGIDAVYQPVLSFGFALLLTVGLGWLFRSGVNKAIDSKNVAPKESFSLFVMLEALVGFLVGLSREHCGKYYQSLTPLIAGIFTFILLNNLLGLVPGLPPATEDMSSNLAMGLTVFLVYNGFGIKEHGVGYIKQFAGPFLVLAPLFLVLETISHLVRPMSLSLRLTANIFGDHLLLGVFNQLVPFLIPAVLLFMGLLVAVIQSFVFTLLTGIYINMAISHDH